MSIAKLTITKFIVVFMSLYFMQINSVEAKQGFTFCNKADQHIDIAIGYYSNGNWKSNGWYGIVENACKDINWNLKSGKYYVYGLGNKGSYWGANYKFCTSSEAFSISGDKNCSARGFNETGFSEITIKPGTKHFTYTLTGNKPSTATRYSKIDYLNVGDGVYVQGILSDELVYIVRIDKSDNTVKVRRRSDGTTTWVKANKIITREQSTVNDVGRTVVVAAALYCLFSPKEC